ncbi:MAG: hypothetical protein ACFCU3_04965 [Verrucomicrobiales bacterium]
MKNLSLPTPVILLPLATAFSIGLVGCFPPPEPERPPRFGYQGAAVPGPSVSAPMTSNAPVEGTGVEARAEVGAAMTPPATQSVAPASPTATEPAAAAPTAPESRRYGVPVPGRPGFISSPHNPGAGFIDVRGFPPGTEVNDPYSDNVLLVP